jgi:hypothetical protein
LRVERWRTGVAEREQRDHLNTRANHLGCAREESVAIAALV